MRGAPIRYTISYLRSQFGDATYHRIVEATPPDVRTALERDTFLSTGWYPIVVLRDLQFTADRVCGNGSGALVSALNAAQAEARLMEAKEALAAGPLAALGRLAREWRTDVRNGVYLDIADRRVGSFEIEFLVDSSLLQEGWLRHSASAWFRRGAELAGARDVQTQDEVEVLTNEMRQLTLRILWQA
jgi:hypothetical protein